MIDERMDVFTLYIIFLILFKFVPAVLCVQAFKCKQLKTFLYFSIHWSSFSSFIFLIASAKLSFSGRAVILTLV